MRSRYEWFIDWGDDGFRHPASAIPLEHVDSHLVDWGSTLTADSPSAGVLTAGTGQLTLFEASGLYLGLTSTLSEAMLALPHRWRLDVEGVTQRQGRAFPVVSAILGPDVQPVRWDLLGPNTDQLDTIEAITVKAGTAVAAAKAISDASGISVTTTSPLNLAEIEWDFTLSGLLNALANVLGGWVVEASDGSFTIVTAEVAAAQDAAVTLGIEYGIGLGSSGMGIQPGLIRTRITLTDSQGRENLLVFGDEERWGRRNFNLPPWYAPEPLSIIPALLARSEPKTFVQLGLLDYQATPERRLALAESAVPGKVVEVSAPTPTATRRAKMLVLRTTLAGNRQSPPERLVRGLVVGDIVIDGTTVLSDPWVTVAEARTSAVAHVPSTANNGDRHWRLQLAATRLAFSGEVTPSIQASFDPSAVGKFIDASAGTAAIVLEPDALVLVLSESGAALHVPRPHPSGAVFTDQRIFGEVAVGGGDPNVFDLAEWAESSVGSWDSYAATITTVPVNRQAIISLAFFATAFRWDVEIDAAGRQVTSGSYKAATPVQDIPLASLTVDTDYHFEASLTSTFDKVKSVDFNTGGIAGPYDPSRPSPTAVADARRRVAVRGARIGTWDCVDRINLLVYRSVASAVTIDGRPADTSRVATPRPFVVEPVSRCTGTPAPQKSGDTFRRLVWQFPDRVRVSFNGAVDSPGNNMPSWTVFGGDAGTATVAAVLDWPGERAEDMRLLSGSTVVAGGRSVSLGRCVAQVYYVPFSVLDGEKLATYRSFYEPVQ